MIPISAQTQDSKPQRLSNKSCKSCKSCKACKACNLPIGVDTQKFMVSGDIYHHKCMKCINCKTQIQQNQRCCVAKPGVFICLNCSTPCFACHEVVDYNETAVVVGPSSGSGSSSSSSGQGKGQGQGQGKGQSTVVYHERCFKCKVCGISLCNEVKYGRLMRGHLVCMTCLCLVQRMKNMGSVVKA
ncbi:unnamed protein product [Ambrosiozyma monospora]|uniref:Unnamed protein product n=1 Tax=Ambrosiozyma monospora TaxID=43982 RepID=A0A9W6Z638_AMBMO|nr:unnamed protein product [Ambrosiozyma monospora]